MNSSVEIEDNGSFDRLKCTLEAHAKKYQESVNADNDKCNYYIRSSNGDIFDKYHCIHYLSWTEPIIMICWYEMEKEVEEEMVRFRWIIQVLVSFFQNAMMALINNDYEKLSFTIYKLYISQSHIIHYFHNYLPEIKCKREGEDFWECGGT